MDVDVAEGDLAGELDAHHHHAGDPQEDDVAARDHRVGRVEGLELRGLVGPAKGRERPQRAGEPGVEHVGVTDPAVALGRGQADVGLVVAVPDGDLVTPPQLARDAPRPDVLHPVEVDLALPVRVEPDLAALDDVDRGSRQLVHAHEPLQRDQRLDAATRALAVRDRVRVLLTPLDQPELVELGDDRCLRLGRGEAEEALRDCRPPCARPRRSRSDAAARGGYRSQSRWGRGRA